MLSGQALLGRDNPRLATRIQNFPSLDHGVFLQLGVIVVMIILNDDNNNNNNSSTTNNTSPDGGGG